MAASVASVEPSSTNTISTSPSGPVTSFNAAQIGATFSASL
jgi:hypothetical protein